MRTKTIAVSGVDPDEHAALKQLADALERTMSNVVRRAIRFYTAHLDEAEAELRQQRSYGAATK